MLIHIAVLLCAIAQICQAFAIRSLSERMERLKTDNSKIISHAVKVMKAADEAIETDRELNNKLIQYLKTMMEGHEDAHG